MTVATVWYRVRDLDAARAFYRDMLGFEETFVDFDDGWSRLAARRRWRSRSPRASRTRRAASRTSTSRTSRPRRSGCATQGVEVGVVFELHGQIRLVDVFDPDGNRIQLAQSLEAGG